MNYIPDTDDLVEHLPELVRGDIDVVAQKLDVSVSRITQLLETDPEAYELVRSAENEFVAMVRLRALLLLPQALDALEMAMAGAIEGKGAMAAVRAAAEVMDRTVMPKITRTSVDTTTKKESRAIPDLAELLERTPPGEADAVIAKYMSMLDDLDALRKGRVIEAE